MKIKVEHKPEVLTRQYPYLGESDGLIVAFSEPQKGVVVKSNGHRMVNESSNCWNESVFTPMHQPQPKIIPVKDRIYPYVGEYKDKPFKVLFTSHENGMVVETESDTHPCFITSDSWIEDRFTPIPVQRIIIEF